MNHKRRCLTSKDSITYLKERQLEAHADNPVAPGVSPFDAKPIKYLADSAVSVSNDTNSVLVGTPLLTFELQVPCY